MIDMASDKLRERFKKARERDESIAAARNNLVLAEQHSVIQWKQVRDKTLRVWRYGKQNRFVDWRPHRNDARLICNNRVKIRRRARLLDDILDILDLEIN